MNEYKKIVQETLTERVSCLCCSLKSLEEMKNLKKYYPELWKELKYRGVIK